MSKNQIQQPLLTTYQLGEIVLNNRIIMSSLTRVRVTNPDGAPTQLNATYYTQRASAGLILSEGTSISKNSIGYINLPGIYTQEQVKGWKLVTDAVKAKNGKMFLQLSHGGSVSHPDFFDGELPAGPSAVNPMEMSSTPEGFKNTVTPRAFTVAEIKTIIQEYVEAAKNAKAAGFYGIEVHAQIFTLIPQFLSLFTNQRTDEYGGSIENRSRFLFEVLDAVKGVFQSNQIGIKFTPAAFFNVIRPDQETIQLYEYLLGKLSDYDLAYVQIVGPEVDLKGTVLEEWNDNYFAHFRKMYKGTLMVNRGFTRETGNAIIESGIADLVSFGEPFIANPDLVERFEKNILLAAGKKDTYYTGAEIGYTDYPAAE